MTDNDPAADIFLLFKERYKDLYVQFWKIHEAAIQKNVLTRGHGPEHDLTVAKFCLQLTDDYETRHLAWLAALLHSIDRLNKSPRSTFKSMLSAVPFGSLCPADKEVIEDAVFHHNERNQPEDSKVLVVLKDADRLANLAPEIIMRAGQFAPTIPSFNPLHCSNPDPSGSYGNLKYAMDDLYYVLEWVMGEKFWHQPQEKWYEYSKANHWFRTEKAWPIAWRYAQIILKYNHDVQRESSWFIKVM